MIDKIDIFLYYYSFTYGSYSIRYLNFPYSTFFINDANHFTLDTEKVYVRFNNNVQFEIYYSRSLNKLYYENLDKEKKH